MPANMLVAFGPRKTPSQARSAVTVEAISEATIQVLMSVGGERLTTTRVAERAGVSVGTLYQYYPNKQALLFAIFEHHMKNMAAMIEAACKAAHHKPLAEMIREMVEAFVDAKMERADISIALYRVSANVGGPALIKQISQRLLKSVEAMLTTAPDAKSPPDKFALDILFAAMSGAMRSLLEAVPTSATVRKSREQLVLLRQSYMAASMAKHVIGVAEF